MSERCVVRLAEKLGLFRDYSTVLLVANNWDEELIVSQWNRHDNGGIARSIVRDVHFYTRYTRCHSCSTDGDCKSYGCNHLLCKECVKGYLEGKIFSGDLNIKCPCEGCEIMMCSSVFSTIVSLESRNYFYRNLQASYNSSLPLMASGYYFVIKNKWLALIALLIALLIAYVVYRGKLEWSFEVHFKI